MSELLMNMQQRRLQRADATPAESSTSASFASTNTNTNTNTNTEQHNTHPYVEQLEPHTDEDPLANILSLKLKKPHHWKWELTTSRSCKKIALPRILLYDHTGALLVDTDTQTERTYRPAGDNAVRPHRRCSEATSTSGTLPSATRKRTAQRAKTTNLTSTLRQALDNEFNGLCIAEATPSPPATPTKSAASSSFSSRRQLNKSSPVANSCIDFYTNELPDYQFERRSSSLKGVRFKDDTDSNVQCGRQCSADATGYPTPPSTVTTTTTATTPTSRSSSSGPREKRRYRRSHSSGRSPAKSNSILERFSYSKGRFSSPEYAEEQLVQHAPRYFLRTSKAGTLIVKEESFSRYRQRRRRPKHSSSENMLNDTSTPRSQSTSSLQKPAKAQNAMLTANLEPALQAGSLQNVAERRSAPTVRRYRSDGNILLAKQRSTSEEEDMLWSQDKQPRFVEEATKRDLLNADPDNHAYRNGRGPTAR